MRILLPLMILLTLGCIDDSERILDPGAEDLDRPIEVDGPATPPVDNPVDDEDEDRDHPAPDSPLNL